MTRRKDPQPEADLPQDQPAVDPVAAADPVAREPGMPESATPEPFVVTDPPDPPRGPDPARPPPPPQVVVRRGGLFPALLGGAIAAVGGFALAHFDVFGLRPMQDPAELAGLSQQVADLQSRLSGLDKLGGDLAALNDRLTKLESAPETPPPDLSRLDDLDQRLAAIEAMPADGAASTAAVTAKLAELERRLAEAPQGASPELQQQLDAALARLNEAEATATARAEEAATAAAAAERTRKLDALSARLSSGEAFGAELQALDDSALSKALSPLAETGVPTLAQLQASFPDAAREALRIAREADAEGGWGERFLDFLASQSGARPLTPLEGDTPEAILSRTEFVLSEGRVAEAIAEAQGLAPPVKAALDPWLVQAEAHVAATTALQAVRGE
jgi:hypothetical protein